MNMIHLKRVKQTNDNNTRFVFKNNLVKCCQRTVNRLVNISFIEKLAWPCEYQRRISKDKKKSHTDSTSSSSNWSYTYIYIFFIALHNTHTHILTQSLQFGKRKSHAIYWTREEEKNEFVPQQWYTTTKEYTYREERRIHARRQWHQQRDVGSSTIDSIEGASERTVFHTGMDSLNKRYITVFFHLTGRKISTVDESAVVDFNCGPICKIPHSSNWISSSLSNIISKISFVVRTFCRLDRSKHRTRTCRLHRTSLVSTHRHQQLFLSM